jgi:hypothetical protein
MPDSTPRDLLTWKTGTIAAILLAGPVLAGRIYAHTVAPVTLALTVLGAMWTVDRLEARRRMIVGTLATLAGCYTLAIIWPWAGPGISVPGSVVALGIGLVVGVTLAMVGVWMAGGNAKASMVGGGIGLALGLTLWPGVAQAIGDRSYSLGVLSFTPLVLGIVAIWCIGGGHDKRTVSKAKAYLPPVIAKNLPVGVIMDKPIVRSGKLSVILKRTPSAPAGALKDFDTKIASAIPGTKRGTVKMIDLGAEMGEGYYRLEVGESDTPFAQPLKPRPAAGEWPDGMVPIGEWGDGSVAWVGPEAAIIGGTRGAGKSWLLENFIWGKLTVGYVLKLLDPKRVQFAKYRGVAGCSVASTEPAMLYEITSLVTEMENRFERMEAQGVEKWSHMPKGSGPMIVLVIDESSDLFANVPEAIAPAVRLAQKGRAAGIELILATQYPDKKSIPMEIKGNSDVNIGLRCSNGTQVNVIKDDREWPLVDPKLPPGRGVLRCSTHAEDWFQTYPSPGIEGLERYSLPTAPPQPAQPPINPAPYAGNSSVAEVATQLAQPVEVAEVADPDDDDLPGLNQVSDGARKDTIRHLLSRQPRTGEWFGEMARCTAANARKHLNNLVKEGAARRVNEGWERQD